MTSIVPTEVADALRIPVTYQREWQDGFGARGWKLDVGINDEYVIASTAYCGENIPTSVLVHDIVDHYLCGFRLSGHRDETMALMQMRGRTGTDITPDYAQMVDEDILHGQINGESLESFLPEDLLALLPAGESDNTRMEILGRRIGERELRKRLIEHFFVLGKSGRSRAEATWDKTGLDYDRREDLALGLQNLLMQADQWMLNQNVDLSRGQFIIDNTECSLCMDGGWVWCISY